jgi:hypothetical protein
MVDVMDGVIVTNTDGVGVSVIGPEIGPVSGCCVFAPTSRKRLLRAIVLALPPRNNPA